MKRVILGALTACFFTSAALAHPMGGYGGHPGMGGHPGYGHPGFVGHPGVVGRPGFVGHPGFRPGFHGAGFGHGGHFWRGQWFPYGVGSCWRQTPYGQWVWVCGDYDY